MIIALDMGNTNIVVGILNKTNIIIACYKVKNNITKLLHFYKIIDLHL